MTAPRPILFMDIDGVLLPERARFLPGQRMDTPYLTSIRHAEPDWPDDQNGGFKWCPVQRKLDPACVSLLRRLIELSGAYLVASTSWRSHPGAGKECIEKALIEAEFDPRPHWHEDWMTPTGFDGGRPREISVWLQDHPDVMRWVALDDEPDLPAPGGLTVSPANGLDLVAYGAALCLLDTDDPDFRYGGGWPAWTGYGDRDKIRRWLDHAFSARRLYVAEIERIEREGRVGRPIEWPNLQEQASRASGARFAQAVPRLIRRKDNSPWQDPEGPAEF